jgi:hypothetical protein
MALYDYLNRIRRLDALIRQKRTGPPKELAEKLDISERWLYIFLDELKTELDCPIRYDRRKRSYVYKKPGKVVIGFTKELKKWDMKKVSGGKKLRFISHCIYLCSSQDYTKSAAKKFGCVS